ncbi:MAG: V-type ATP synthase subunit A [Promethearchaeota archaeon]
MNVANKDLQYGYISEINGSLIKVKGLENQIRIHDLIKVSNYNILGEVIQKYSNHVIIQCFESTQNLKLKEKVINLEEPLSMELAPGLIAKVFDGIQRPLDLAFENFKDGSLKRGIDFPSLSRTKKWRFFPLKKINDIVSSGDVIGSVQETPQIVHKIMIPPGISGEVSFIVSEGSYTIIDEIYRLKQDGKETSFIMLQKWPINQKRPYKEKLSPNEPLITGIRVIDLMFPVPKGGTVAIPGGFGTGKTVIQQCLAKWCNADIVVFIGCGEPGNEIANILKQFTETIDPKTGRPLIEHIVLIANTSNMPVSAREASLFSGVTIAEYFRDMGYSVAVLADSTSRWAESLREISGLLEEMPAEEGYPAYLQSKLSSFYERAGVVKPFGSASSEGERTGSLTIIGSISPPAGDFSEPVTATTKRIVQALWALDPKLSYLKHYPAISWLNSYSNYPGYLSDWWYERDLDWPEINLDWSECRKQVNEILSKENDLKYVIQLLGEKNIQEGQELIIFTANLIKEGFLVQNAYDDIDNYTNRLKLLGMIKLILLLYNEGDILIKKGISIEESLDRDFINEILKIKNSISNTEFEKIEELKTRIIQKIEALKTN